MSVLIADEQFKYFFLGNMLVPSLLFGRISCFFIFQSLQTEFCCLITVTWRRHHQLYNNGDDMRYFSLFLKGLFNQPRRKTIINSSANKLNYNKLQLQMIHHCQFSAAGLSVTLVSVVAVSCREIWAHFTKFFGLHFKHKTPLAFVSAAYTDGCLVMVSVRTMPHCFRSNKIVTESWS